MTKLLTIPEYKDHIKDKKNVTRQAIFMAAQKDKLHLLPDVVKIKKAGRLYLLEVTV